MIYIAFSDDSISLISSKKNLLGKNQITHTALYRGEDTGVKDSVIKDFGLFFTRFDSLINTAAPSPVKEKKITLLVPSVEVILTRLLAPSHYKEEDMGDFILAKIKEEFSQDTKNLENYYKNIKSPDGKNQVIYTAIEKFKLIPLVREFKKRGFDVEKLLPQSFILHSLVFDLLKMTDPVLYVRKHDDYHEHIILDVFGPVKYYSHKTKGSGGIAKDLVKNINEVFEKTGIKISKIIISGPANERDDLNKIREESGLEVLRMEDILSDTILKGKVEIDSNLLISKNIYDLCIGMVVSADSDLVPNFAQDLKLEEETTIVKEEDIKTVIKPEDEVMPVEREVEERDTVLTQKESKPVIPEEEKIPVNSQNESGKSAFAFEGLPDTFIEREKSGLAKFFSPKSLIIFILSLALVFAVIVFGLRGKDMNFNLPFTNSPTITPDPTLMPTETPVPTIDPNLKRSDLKVRVENGTETSGLAGGLADYLEDKGYDTVERGNADNKNYTQTIVKVKKDKSGYVPLLKDDIEEKYPDIKEEELNEGSQYDLIIIIGLEKTEENQQTE